MSDDLILVSERAEQERRRREFQVIVRISNEARSWFEAHEALLETRRQDIAALTARAEQAEAANAFVTRLLMIMGDNDCCDSMFWHSRTESGALRFVMNCGDVFFWGSADCEEITPENIDVLERSFADCKAIDDSFWAYNGPMLFCARVRGERPQGACYPSDERFWPLFDACGPEREVGLGNPYKPGEYKPRNYMQEEKAARERAETDVVRLKQLIAFTADDLELVMDGESFIGVRQYMMNVARTLRAALEG